MRRLLVIRHAKAKRESPHGDHGRVLTHRGRAQAAMLRTWTEPGGPLADVSGTAIVSDAARTLETFELGLAGTSVVRRAVVDPALYNGHRHVSTADVLASLRAADDGDGDLVFVGHNPTVIDVTFELAEDQDAAEVVLREGFPLGGAALLAVDGPFPRERGCRLLEVLWP